VRHMLSAQVSEFLEAHVQANCAAFLVGELRDQLMFTGTE